MILYPDTPRAKLFPRGVILWRSVDISRQGTAELREIDFPKTPQGSYIVRCGITGNWLYEPEVYQAEEQVRGFVVFLKELPPPDWTHLTVSGCSKKMFEDPRTNPMGRGCTIFADPGQPYDAAGYLAFRLEMYEEVLKNLEDDTWDARHSSCMDTWPPDFRIKDKRLIYYPFGENENGVWFPQFEHQEIEP